MRDKLFLFSIGRERPLHLRPRRPCPGLLRGLFRLPPRGGGDAAVPLEDQLGQRQGRHTRGEQDGPGQDEDREHCR